MAGKKHWLDKSGRSVASWLDIDLEALEVQLLKSIEEVADPTRSEWIDLMSRLEAPEGVYHVGELAPSGDLTCTKCGRKVHLYVPQELTSCTRCHNVEFLYQDENLH